MASFKPKRRFPRPRLAQFRRRRPINLLPSVLTIFNLYWGAASMLASMNGDYDKAAIYIFIAMVFDGLDGAVARLTNSTSLFGKELDGLCDMVSFGVAPAVLIYHGFILGAYEPETSLYFLGSMVVIGYVICGALRLARFSVFQIDRPDSFAGLPTPAAAVVSGSFVLFAGHIQWAVPFWVFTPLLFALSLLMVSVVRYPKWRLQLFTLPPRRPYLFLMCCILGIVAFHYAMERSVALVLFPLAMVYVGYGLVDTAYARLRLLWTGPDPSQDAGRDDQAPATPDEHAPEPSEEESGAASK